MKQDGKQHQVDRYILQVRPVGGRCDLACRYCPTIFSDRLTEVGDPSLMRDSMLERLVREYLALGCPESVFTWHGGEPTLAGFPFFRRVVTHQIEYGDSGRTIGNVLQTNGMHITDEWASFLAEFRFLTAVSLDGPPDIHDRYRLAPGGAPSHEHAIRAAETLIRHGAGISAKCMVTRLSEDRGAELYRYFVDRGFTHLQFVPCVEYDPLTEEPHPFSVTPAGYGRFLCSVFDTWLAGKDIGRVSVSTFESFAALLTGRDDPGECQFGSRCGRYLVVEPSGDVYACKNFTAPEYLLGTIGKTPLEAMLGSLQAKSFALRKQRADMLCEGCPSLPLCHGGCVKHRIGPGGIIPDLPTILCEGLRMFYNHAADAMRRLCALETERI